MVPPSPFFISNEEFKSFHTIDRNLYILLVMTLWRDPIEAMQIMALWLWIERVGFSNVVKKILSLPNSLINKLADEAVTCLMCLTSDHFTILSILSENNDILLMKSLTNKDMSLEFIYENRLAATRGVARIVNEVCVRALGDIMQQAVQRNAVQSLIDRQKMAAQSFQPPLYRPAVMPQQMVQPRTHKSPAVVAQHMAQPQTQETEVPPDARTMFVTFSKGYPVKEREVRGFFIRGYGDCIESLHMQDVPQKEQSLFARIVFRSTSTIDVILNGEPKAKFTINGKHVWARKFVPKRPKLLQCLPSPSGS